MTEPSSESATAETADDDRDGSTVHVRLSAPGQLFNSLDPSPFNERDLDADAERYIVDWVRELAPGAPLRLVVHLPAAAAATPAAAAIPDAIAGYFRAAADAAERDLRELFRTGRRHLAVGLLVLAVCLTASQLAATALGTGAAARLVEESLIILGWVANWKPIETFLYDWWPVRRRRDLLARIAAAAVIVRATPERAVA